MQLESKLAIATMTTSSLGFEMEDDTQSETTWWRTTQFILATGLTV